MPISQGLLNQTLILQSKNIESDGMGGHRTLWIDEGSFRGRISPLSAQEKLAQDKTTMMTTHKIFCNNMAVTPENRIKWGTYLFEIIAIVNPSETYHHLEIMAREIYVY